MRGLPEHISAILKMRIYSNAMYVQTHEYAGRASVKLQPVLAGLCNPLLVRLVQALQVNDFMPGQLMIEDGDFSDGLRWIWTGTFEILDCEGKHEVSNVHEGIMLGENCLVKGSPKNCCSIRASAWSNVLVLRLDEMSKVFLGYDRDLHWLMSFAEIRWPRFAAAVALSNVLEILSRLGLPLVAGLYEVANMDEQHVDQTLINMKVAEAERQEKRKKQNHGSGYCESHLAPLAIPALSDGTQTLSHANQKDSTHGHKQPHSSGILKTFDEIRKKERSVSVSAQDFGSSENTSSKRSRDLRATALKCLHASPQIVYGSNLGIGGAAGGRSAMERHETGQNDVLKDIDQNSLHPQMLDKEGAIGSSADDDDWEGGLPAYSDQEQSLCWHSYDDDEDQKGGTAEIELDEAVFRSPRGDAGGMESEEEECEYDEHLEVENCIPDALARVTGMDRELMLSTTQLADMTKLALDGDQLFDVHFDWLESEQVVDKAEELHAEAFPRSKLMVTVEKISGLLASFQKKFNVTVKVCFGGVCYDTLVAEGTSAEADFLETYIWTGKRFDEISEIHFAILDVKDATHTSLIGTCDVPLSFIEQEDEWKEHAMEVLDVHGELKAVLHLNIKYSPLRGMPGEASRLVEELADAKFIEDEKKLITTLQQIYEQLLSLQDFSLRNQDCTQAEIKETCRALFMARKALPRSAVSIAKKILRQLMGENDADLFIEAAFGQDGDSQDSNIDNEEQEVTLTEVQQRKFEIWKEFTSSSGQPFWYNRYTREAIWHDPFMENCKGQSDTNVAMSSAVGNEYTILLQDLPAGWVQRQSRRNGFVYYQEKFTGERSWEQPLRPLASRNPLEALGEMITVEILEHKNNKKYKTMFRSIPMRVTAGTSDGLLPQSCSLKQEDESSISHTGTGKTARVYEYMVDASRKDVWRLKSETVVPRRNEVLRAEIIYDKKDSRSIYRGEMKSNQRCGLGMLALKDGVVYHGQFAHDIPNGLAVETYPAGFVYRGEFVNDDRHGLGIIQCPGLAFIGYWQHGKRHGIGVERFIVMGQTLESVVHYNHGNLVIRTGIDVENKEEVAALKLAAGQKSRKAALLAEKARLVAVSIQALRGTEIAKVEAMRMANKEQQALESPKQHEVETTRSHCC